MQSIRLRDLIENALPALRKQLVNEGAIVITEGNRPFAAMISLAEENVQDILMMVSQLRAQMAVLSIRSQAHRDGLDKMTLREVNAVINRTRVERRS